MNVVALIPARSGSKGVIDKNIKLLNGKPLISHAIDAGKNSEFINDVFISIVNANVKNL